MREQAGYRRDAVGAEERELQGFFAGEREFERMEILLDVERVFVGHRSKRFSSRIWEFFECLPEAVVPEEGA